MTNTACKKDNRVGLLCYSVTLLSFLQAVFVMIRHSASALNRGTHPPDNTQNGRIRRGVSASV